MNKDTIGVLGSNSQIRSETDKKLQTLFTHTKETYIPLGVNLNVNSFAKTTDNPYNPLNDSVSWVKLNS